MVKVNSYTDGRKKSTIWNFISLNIGFLISVINGVLIVPLYLHYIDSSVYGAWLATGNILTWITLVDPGVSDVLLQRVAYAIGKNDKKEIGLSITSGIIISVILFFVAVLLGYGFSFFIGALAHIDPKREQDIVSAFRIALWGTALALIADTFRNIILAYQKTKVHGIFLNMVLILAIIINVILLILGYGVHALAYANLFRGLALLTFAAVYSFYLLKENHVILRFEMAYFWSFSQIFGYTFSSKLFETFASNIDLLIVSRYLGPAAVTMLDLSRRPIKIIAGLTNNITQSMLPTLPHLFGSGDLDKIQNTSLRLWNIIWWMTTFIMGGFIIFNHSLISNWVGNKFWIGTSNNIVLCISFFLLSIGYNFSNITLAMGDMKNNSLINTARSIVYIILLVILAKFLGLIGILLAFLISLLMVIIYYPRKIYHTLLNKIKSKIIFSEIFILLCVIGLSIFLGYIYDLKLSWFLLIVSCIFYASGFILTLFIFSEAFKREMTDLRIALKSKIKN